jgi:hypothetical protein
MDGGICGPQNNGTTNHSRDITIKQRKVPYKDHSGTVLASYEGPRVFVKMYQAKNKNYITSWYSILSSGSASYTNKINAIREYNSKVSSKYKI